jgi:hypothetical protein
LEGIEASTDVATEDNLNRLVQIGRDLLNKPVSRINLETGKYEPVGGGGTNAQALDRFAEILSAQRKLLLES